MICSITFRNLLARVLEKILRSEHNKLTGRQFLISCKSPFFGNRVITALLQLKGSASSAKLSFRTASRSSPLLGPKGFIKFHWEPINAMCPAALHLLKSSIKLPFRQWSLQLCLGVLRNTTKGLQKTGTQLLVIPVLISIQPSIKTAQPFV